MKEIKISEILHLAADKYLSSANSRAVYLSRSDIFNQQYDSTLQWYSCWAIGEALWEYLKGYHNYYEEVFLYIEEGLQAMGCDTNSSGLFKDSSNPQGDRYMWLKFAAIIAEEQEAAGYKLEI